MAEAATAITLENESCASSEGWAQALNLPCALSVDVPMPEFTVADLLRLQENSIVKSQWRVGADVPVRVNGRLIWSRLLWRREQPPIARRAFRQLAALVRIPGFRPCRES